MSMTRLFYIPNRLELVLNSNGVISNMPLYNTEIRIQKRINNKITMLVCNNDRKPYQLKGKELRSYIIDRTSNELLFSKKLDIIDEDKAQYELVLTKGEIQNWKAGFYKLVTTFEDANNWEELLFVGQQDGSVCDLYVENTAFNLFNPAEKMTSEDWQWFETYDDDNILRSRYHSSSINANQQENSTNGLHTISISLDNYMGKFWIQTSMNNDVPAFEQDWSNIKLSENEDYVIYGDEIVNQIPNSYTPISGIKTFNLIIQTNWFRFIHEPFEHNEGHITKILVRN